MTQLSALRAALRPVAAPLAGAAAVEALAAVAAVAPAVLIVELARALLERPIDSGSAWTFATALVVCVVAYALLSSLALVDTSISSMAGTSGGCGRDSQRKSDVCRWDGSRRTTLGRSKRMLQDDTHAIHYVVAHAILDLVSGFAVPVLGFAYLFTVDWRIRRGHAPAPARVARRARRPSVAQPRRCRQAG